MTNEQKRAVLEQMSGKRVIIRRPPGHWEPTSFNLNCLFSNWERVRICRNKLGFAEIDRNGNVIVEYECVLEE